MNGNLDSSAPTSTKPLPEVSINNTVIPTRYDNGHSIKPVVESEHESRNNFSRHHDPTGPNNHHNRRDHRMPLNTNHPPHESHPHPQQQSHLNHHNFNNHGEKKNKNFKLLCDPMLNKRFQTKKIRYDGQGDVIELKDPRPRHTAWNPREVMDLLPTRFRIDKNYSGTPPAIEVSITNLNDNIDKSFLEHLLKKHDMVEEVEIFYHPTTKKHLGLAKILFITPNGAENCVNRLNQTSVMGNIINVFYDSFGKKVKQIYENIVNPSVDCVQNLDTFVDPNNLEIASTLPPLSASTDFGYMTDSSVYGSNFPTPASINYDSQFYTPDNQYYDDNNKQWENGTQNSNTDPNQSPVRESLTIRLENLFRDNRLSNFPTDIDFSSFGINDAPFYRKNEQKSIDDSPAILGTPPSPFISASEYVRWHKYTKDVDLGKDPNEIQVDQEVDDDDRMSLSSLSSGDKLDDTSMPATMYLNEAQMKNWKPLMPIIPGIYDQPHYSNLLPSFLPIMSDCSYPSYSSFNMSMANNYFEQITQKEKEKNKLEQLDILTEVALEECMQELVTVIIKDMIKKLLTTMSTKIDNWWNNASNSYQNISNDNVRSLNRTENRETIHIPQFYNRYAQRPEGSTLQYGISRQMKQADAKNLPSFNKKKKITSPPRLIDDKLSDISADEDELDQKSARHRRQSEIGGRRRKYKRRRHSSSESSRSRSSSSESSRSASSSSRSSYTSKSSHYSHSSESSSDEDSSSFSKTSSESCSSDSESDSEAKASSRFEPDSDSDSSTKEFSDTEKQSNESELDETSNSKLAESVDTSPKVASPLSVTLEAFPKKPSPTEREEAIDEILCRDGSDTDTADEAVEAMNEEKAREAKNKTQSTTEKEFEASQALIALANNLFGSSSVANVDSEREQFYQANPIAREHNYARPVLPLRPPSKTKKESDNTEKRKRSKKKELITDENLAPEVGAVASEWRKAKRKALTAKSKVEFATEKLIEITKEPEVKITYPARDEEAEKAILTDYEQNGLDAEDILYLKRSYQQLLQTENSAVWVNDIHWVDHPPTVMYHPRKKRKSDNQHIHKTGCARTEGYYKLDMKDKMKYSHVANSPIANTVGNKNIRMRQVDKPIQQLSSRENRSNQRRVFSAYDDNINFLNLLKYNQLTLRKKKLTFAKSRIHDWGLFALETIAADEFVIEYTGQRIRSIVADTREKRYERKGIDTSYLFRIDTETIVDATKCGNVARFINHSCSPNCYAKIIMVEGQKKIVIYSKQQINIGEEITYDYKFPLEESKIHCLCGSSQCRGFLN